MITQKPSSLSPQHMQEGRKDTQCLLGSSGLLSDGENTCVCVCVRAHVPSCNISSPLVVDFANIKNFALFYSFDILVSVSIESHLSDNKKYGL